MQTQEIIDLPSTSKPQAYKIAINQRSTLGAVANENIVQASVEKKLLYTSKIGNAYEIVVKNRKQSNVEGIRGIENDLSFLQERLKIQTNSNGLPIDILNLDEVNEAWEKYKRSFEKAHKSHENIEELIAETDVLLSDNKTFVATFTESEIGTLFFPPIYSELDETAKEVSENKTFQSFFGAVDLPLKLTNTIKKEKGLEGKIQLLRKGEIDLENFDYYNIRKQFRKLADNLQLAVSVDTKYIETYDIDEFYGVQHAGQILAVQIEGLFSYEQIVRITPIKE